MKKILKKIRTFLVVAYANHIYKKIVKKANKFHKKYKTRFYVKLDESGNNLQVLNRKGFRMIKRHWFRSMQNDRMINLMEGAIYYTADRSEKNGMNLKEVEARRLYFINSVLKNSEK